VDPVEIQYLPPGPKEGPRASKVSERREETYKTPDEDQKRIEPVHDSEFVVAC
jgi:hypothetical protein